MVVIGALSQLGRIRSQANLSARENQSEGKTKSNHEENRIRVEKILFSHFPSIIRRTSQFNTEMVLPSYQTN